MQMSNTLQTFLRPLALTAALSMVVVSGAQAAEPVTHFDLVQKVQGSTLKLNGQGTRYRLVSKAYAVALYTPHKVRSTEELFALSGPKRLNFVALRDVSGTDLGLSFIKALVANSEPELVQKNADFTTRMIDIFSARARLVSGSTFAIEYVPNKGTTFYLDDEPKGAPIGGSEFFEMVLKIWFGPTPVDFKLKDALLGL